MQGVLDRVWPLHGIRLAMADLDLRVMTEADLPEVCDVLPPDLELNPHATTYAGLDVPANRRAVVVQGYWRALGMWSPEDWALPFVVRRAGRIIGGQWLEGPDYRADRTVDSSSWLVHEARGRGYGRQMRAAVLELAFGRLGARAAISSAVVDNAASLGVSYRLGYRDTHTSVLEHSGERLQHVRLERAAWLRGGHGADVGIEGVEAALPLFGPLPGAGAS
ncbi:GNAT family N-acetyltransferase [Intrasporangium sp. YIM S08009]|uniref:GNAT family N-acetyltransferase n=1 Tax=Intrasporangium zincisolvens TaxID=3080018 RepID=UPI002B0540EC|nr:GNAT family N-acetyltransferase [Intrasporangium sp. YIM S08009]